MPYIHLFGDGSMAKRIEDAGDRYFAAKESKEHYDYVGALLEAQKCIEYSVKALLDKLEIDYKIEGRFVHDVSDRIPEAFEEVKARAVLHDHEVKSYEEELSRAAVLLRMLSSIKGYRIRC